MRQAPMQPCLWLWLLGKPACPALKLPCWRLWMIRKAQSRWNLADILVELEVGDRAYARFVEEADELRSQGGRGDRRVPGTRDICRWPSRH